MAWYYHKNGYPKNRQDAIRAALSVREEDIDYSDIPPLEIPEGFVPQRVGNKFREVGKRNLAALNKILKEYHELKREKEEREAKERTEN